MLSTLACICATVPLFAQPSGRLDLRPPVGVRSITQESPPPSQKGRVVRAELIPRPALRFFGDTFTLELRATLQGDARRFDPRISVGEDDYVFQRRRVGVDGEIFSRVTFQIERDLRDQEDPWRDLYVNVRLLRELEIRAGKFKAPFSLDELTSTSDLDFAHRSLGASYLAPGRDVGVMVHGNTRGQAVTYAVGVFKADAEGRPNVFLVDEDAVASFSNTSVARLTARPLRPFGGPNWLGEVEVGVNVALTDVPEGLNGLRGRTIMGHEYFPQTYVKGKRRRFGVDIRATPGPFSISSEFVEARDERRDQGIGNDDLPDLFGRDWYVAGTWLLTGENKRGGVTPTRPFLQGGIGAVELAVRHDHALFGSVEGRGEPAFRNPRAVNLLRNGDRVTTAGVNWYLNRYLKFLGNAVREQFEDEERAFKGGQLTYWTYVFRLQLSI